MFGRLQEHEIELERIEKHVDQEKKPKSLTLKTKVKDHDINQEDESQSTSDEDDALIKKLEKILKEGNDKGN